MNKLRVTEAFGGIGSQRRALQAIGIPFEVVEYIDFDKYCVASYNAMYDEHFEPIDITQLKRLKPTDLLTYSFPCQDISSAGLGHGIVRGGTRSGLLYEIERLLLQAKEDGWLPKYLLLENVKNLVSKRFKPQFNAWLDFLYELGYSTEWFILNTKDYGIAQNRERVFAVSKLGKFNRMISPPPIELKYSLADYIEPFVNDKYFLPNTVEKLLENVSNREFLEHEVQQVGNIVTTGNYSNPTRGRVYSVNGVAPSICTISGGGLEPKILIVNAMSDGTCRTIKRTYEFTSCVNITKTGTYGSTGIMSFIPLDEQNKRLRTDGTVGTLTADGSSPKKNNRIVVAYFDEYGECEIGIRKLIPLECWRLQGFSDSDFYKAQKALNDTFYKGKDMSSSQLYKQAGNSISTCCLIAIFYSLFYENSTDYERFLIDYAKTG